MTQTAVALLLDFGLVALLVGAFSYASVLLGPRRTLRGDKGLPYETGLPPLAPAAAGMTASYHRFAVLFVVFDLDLAFLAPWVLLRRSLSWGAMASLSVFLALAALALAYVWRKGALEA